MSRLLQELPGTDKLLSEKTTKCAGVFFYQSNGDDPAELIGKMDFAEDIMNDLGGDFYFISHKDFHEYVYSLCTNSGVEIRHEFEVVEVISRKNDPNSSGPTVVGHFGERITADIVIGADGKKSVAYKVLLAEEEEDAEDDSDDDSLDTEKSVLPPLKVTIGATMTIPISLVQSDPELASLLAADDYWSVFMGNKIHTALYKGLDEYVLALTYSGLPPQVDDQDEEWVSKGTPVKKVLERAEGFGPRIKKLIRLASTSHWFIQTLYDLPQHVSKLDEVVLIGDAVHTIYINGTHNTAAAFEEAFTLGRLFSMSSSCNSKEYAHILLNGYRQIQHKRTRALEMNCMDAVVILGFLAGPERERRNSGFRLTLNLDGADDATLEHVWSGYIAQFNYDARDAVDEWWMNWSRLAERSSLSSLSMSIATGC